MGENWNGKECQKKNDSIKNCILIQTVYSSEHIIEWGEGWGVEEKNLLIYFST
jgi:hypothetical protein